MGTVFISVGLSVDGFMAPAGMDLAHADDPTYNDWSSQWLALQQWMFAQRFFRENLKLGDGGETGEDNRILEQTFNRTGVSIMGKRMFEGGERFWPEDAPFHTPVFVLTKQVRGPWERPGGTTFHFVNDGIESALRQARAVAGGKDIRIAGGAHAIVQYLNAGLVDEVSIALAPVVFGAGIRLFDGIDHSARTAGVSSLIIPRLPAGPAPIVASQRQGGLSAATEGRWARGRKSRRAAAGVPWRRRIGLRREWAGARYGAGTARWSRSSSPAPLPPWLTLDLMQSVARRVEVDADEVGLPGSRY